MNQLEQLLDPYLERSYRKGPELWACCPLPDHDDSTPSFSINVETGLWNCFGCHQGGTLGQLLHKLGLSPQRRQFVESFVREQQERQQRHEQLLRARRTRRNPLVGQHILPESLTGVYYRKPIDLVNAGFDPYLLRELGVGYDLRTDRIMFPLRDAMGNLIGYAGKATIPGEHPKYRVYRGGTDGSPGDYGEEFDKLFPKYQPEPHSHLWNGHRIRTLPPEERTPFIVVEGYKACIWLVQNGWPATVALLGSYMSREQHQLLHILAPDVLYLMLDGDQAGCLGTEKIGGWLARTKVVRVVQYPDEERVQPDDLNAEEIRQSLAEAERYR